MEHGDQTLRLGRKRSVSMDDPGKGDGDDADGGGGEWRRGDDGEERREEGGEAGERLCEHRRKGGVERVEILGEASEDPPTLPHARVSQRDVERGS